MAGTTWWWGWTPRPCVYIPSAYTIQYITKGGEEKKETHWLALHKSPAGEIETPWCQRLYSLQGSRTTIDKFPFFLLPSSSLLYTVSNWMLFGHCSSGVVLDYFVHIPPSLFSIIVQLLRFTIPIFFLLFFIVCSTPCCLLCAAVAAAAGTFPIGNQRPANPWSIVPRLLAGCLFVFPPPLYTGRRTLHTLDCRWTDSGERERERGLYMTGPVKIFRPWRTWWNRSATRFFFLSFFLSSLIQIESCTHTMAIKNEKRYIPHVVSLHM